MLDKAQASYRYVRDRRTAAHFAEYASTLVNEAVARSTYQPRFNMGHDPYNHTGKYVNAAQPA